MLASPPSITRPPRPPCAQRPKPSAPGNAICCPFGHGPVCPLDVGLGGGGGELGVGAAGGGGGMVGDRGSAPPPDTVMALLDAAGEYPSLSR